MVRLAASERESSRSSKPAVYADARPMSMMNAGRFRVGHQSLADIKGTDDLVKVQSRNAVLTSSGRIRLDVLPDVVNVALDGSLCTSRVLTWARIRRSIAVGFWVATTNDNRNCGPPGRT